MHRNVRSFGREGGGSRPKGSCIWRNFADKHAILTYYVSYAAVSWRCARFRISKTSLLTMPRSRFMKKEYTMHIEQ
uniref:Uncharacterized protein n=1 Tax=Trichogramma kaykai TaxID=54128 RepID=A0ABD2XE77_9HYME